MKNTLSHLFITTSDWISSRLLDNPYLFNHIRYLLAGNQHGMKKFIKTHLEKYECKSVADICSGTGDFASLIPNNARYIGWDLNQDFIDFARKRYHGDTRRKFIKADVLNAKQIQTKQFDAVLLISTVHHFSDEDLKTLLPLVKKITKKVVIIADIIPDPPHLIQKMFARLDRGKFVRPADEKIAILKKHFTIVHTEPIPTRSAVQFGIVCEPKKDV